KKRCKHIISTRVEHSSIFNALKQLKEEFGYEITLLNTNSKGQVELEELKKYLREDTILVSIMGINNESGAIQPIKEIAEYVHNNSRAVVHMDAVQMLGKMEIDLSYIDMASFSAHKIYGLKGSGILYKKNIIELMPIINGGQQEYGLRGGTSNACTNIVLAKTLRLALEDMNKHYKYVKELHDYLYDEIEKIKEMKINSDKDGSPYIINYSCDYISSEIFMNSLNNKGYACSAQSTCSSRTKEPSRIILAMGLSEQRALNAIRCSISHLVTKEEIDSYIATIKEIVYGYKTK
ncbi:MAG: aminotransferase class V-fold PLP-dependent enzyme, partial [Erysipelotrichaceae bacterium]